MSTAAANVRRDLRRVISRFKFDELEEAVLPSFPELTWNKLRSSLVKHHQNFTVAASIHVIEQTIQDAEIGDRDLRDRLSTLELMDISRHPKRKVWICRELHRPSGSPNFQTDQEIEKRLSQIFSTNICQMDVRVTTHDNITFVAVRDSKSKKQRKTRVYSLFFAFFIGQKYLFTSRKTVPTDYLTSIAEGLGYNDSRLVKLSGRDLKSLMELLWAKQQATINNENILKPPEFTGLKPVVGNTGIDFTGAEQRGEYIDKCYGIEPPSTQSLHLTFVNQTWKCSELVPEVADEVIDIKWEFHSPYIPGMIKELVKRRVMRIPLPVYAENMLTIGKNELTLRS